MRLEKGGNEMISVNDLITAIMNRNFDRDEIESDIAFVNARFHMLQTYFDAVYKESYGHSVARTLANDEHITSERYVEYIEGLESKTADCLDTAIAACDQINKMCDQYGLQHLCPDVEYDERHGNKCVNRNEIADFIGDYMYSVFEQGRKGRIMEPIETE